MTILSGQTIRHRCKDHDLITPFHERTKAYGLSYGCGPSGYDIRIAEDIHLGRQGFKLASSIEHFIMPADLQATVRDKSTWARRGVAVQNTVIEPGWRGYLTMELTNHGLDNIFIKQGTPIAQVIFELLDEPTEMVYEGKYQDQEAGPQPARLEPE